MNKILKMTDTDFRRHMSKICRDIVSSDWRPDYVVGITRGGLLPAVMISHYFKIPMKTLDVSLRDGGDTVSNLAMAEDARLHKILLVDDINDTGATFNWIIKDWEETQANWPEIWNRNVKFAVVVDNLSSKCSLAMDYCGVEIDKSQEDVWIDFPYESWWTA